jgi:molybdenum cofactor cytidylyltransferase
MGGDKLLLLYQGKALLQRAVELLSDLPVYEKIIVTTKARLESIVLPQGIKAIINQCPEEGQSVSVRLGIENSTGTHYFFMAADQPGLRTDAIIPLLEAAGENIDKIIFPVVNKNPGSPTLFPARFRNELLALSGDMGGRAVRDAHPGLCHAVKPENPEFFLDIDNEEEYNDLV